MLNDIFFQCPDCGAKSYNPSDLFHGYCGACHRYVLEGHGFPASGLLQMPALTPGEWSNLLVVFGMGMGAVMDSFPTEVPTCVRLLNKIGAASSNYEPYDEDHFPRRGVKQ